MAKERLRQWLIVCEHRVIKHSSRMKMLPGYELDWRKIYSLPFKVALDMHTREFQYKIPNRIVFSNTKLTRKSTIKM